MSPDNTGNSVIIGHRYTYSGSSTFYNLDKVKIGDPIIIYWGGKELDYRVRETKVVPASAVEIERQTDERILTLYTCTPLWSSKHRLVVVAEPVSL